MMMMGVLGTLLAREDMWQETCGVVVEQCGRCMLMRKRERGWEQTEMTMTSLGEGSRDGNLGESHTKDEDA